MVRATSPSSLLLLLSLFGWAGLVAGICFLEAPIRFTASAVFLGAVEANLLG